MARKKKKGQFGDFGDWQDMPDADDMAAAAEPEVAKVSLEDFLIMDKVDAFLRTYEPAKVQTLQTEEFDDARLREYFKAYVCGLGDPLKVYVEELRRRGFTMQTSIVTGQPVILADPVY